jgi:hypothetical protein
VFQLPITGCARIVDINALGNVHSLYLKDVPQIHDNYSLTILLCGKIQTMARVVNVVRLYTDWLFATLARISFPKLKFFTDNRDYAKGEEFQEPLRRFLTYRSLFFLQLHYCLDLTALIELRKFLLSKLVTVLIYWISLIRRESVSLFELLFCGRDIFKFKAHPSSRLFQSCFDFKKDLR